MSDEVSKEAFDAAFGRGPSRPVTEADQAVARAFGHPVPELTEAPRASSSAPAEEMEALVREYEELRVSRRGDSRKAAHNAAITERVLMSETVAEGRRSVRRVTNLDRLRQLRETVEALRAEVPLSASGPSTSPEVSVEDFDRAFGGERFASDGRRYTQAEVDESIARAFGRATRGDQR
ncbi:hypothetical protein [Janibacter terrae]|uniref:hypothetical protein n=1 Tax=Janibacter terrae TaxID=103817 RepID=UPI0031F8351C